MKYNFLERTAKVVLLTFISMIATPCYSYSQSESIVNELDAAKELYEKGDVNKAIEKFDSFIESIEKNGQKEIYKAQLSEAYYYKSKIFFIIEKYEEMEKALRNLYEINPNYDFVEIKDPGFLKKTKEIKDKWKKEKIIEQPGTAKKKKKFPWLVVIAGVGLTAGVVIGILSKKKKTEKKTLTVSVEEGVEGNPASGTYSYKKGESVSYSYSLKNGYSDLSVKLDGTEVAANGSIKMDQDHSLTVSAGKKYTLTVLKGTGVNGTPDSGTYFYNEGDQVSYNYSLQGGYETLTVTIDGENAPASGTITMNRDHTLIASSGQTFNLTVQKGPGVTGTPASGTFNYPEGQTVNYSYGLQSGYANLFVTLDGIQVTASGTITMDRDHTLIVTATPEGQYTLTVTKGTGVNGTPNSGTTTHNQGASVSYNYSLQSGYKDLVVTLDGNSVGTSGTITMNANHTLSASATKIGQYNLTVTKGAGVNGTPNSGTTTHNEGASVSYNYSLQAGYTNLVVTLDGKAVGAIGIITMNANHTLIATATPLVNQYTLTVTKGAGVNGTPDSGTTTHNQGAAVSYNYTLQTGYTNLVVTLDGSPVSASGTVTMNANHTLSASATPQGNQYTLTVTKGPGVNGTPETGTYTHNAGASVYYEYSLKNGYTNLVVKLDGNAVSASGNIPMNSNHSLTVSAAPIGTPYTLTVTKGTGVNGTPGSGTYSYSQGATVSYNYSLQSGYINLVVTLDGNIVSASGTITMNANHTLIATTSKGYTLTVTKGAGVDGTPNSGPYPYSEGKDVVYNYTVLPGYQDLVVTLDGNKVDANGTIIMNANHTLVASATKQWKLTVKVEDGVDGTPEPGSYTFANGEQTSYSYNKKDGYKDLIVTLNGDKVADSGNITMNKDYELAASATPIAVRKDKK